LTVDEQIFQQCYGANGSPTMLSVMMALTLAGSGWMMFPLVPLLFWKGTKRFAGSLLATFTVTGIVVFVLKMIFRRPRPCNSLRGVHGLFGTPDDFSFPSGHASGSFAFALFVVVLLVHAGRREPARATFYFWMGALTLALAAAISFSRIYLGAHFPGDVLAGAILGGTLGALGARRHVSRLASGAASDTK
jgi:undecaprenyl-diphosphatase